MYVDASEVIKIIGTNKRFPNPDSEPDCYYIAETSVDKNVVELYLQKLQYASEHANEMIETVFQTDDFYGFYGVDKKRVKSPKEMCAGLRFDSFVLFLEDSTIGACLSNEKYMPGHFIECRWSLDWDLLWTWIN